MTHTDRLLGTFAGLVGLLVDHPDEVRVTHITTESTTLHIHVHPEDLGKVIGKGGRTARALRVLLCAISAATRQRYLLHIVQPNNQPQPTAQPEVAL